MATGEARADVRLSAFFADHAVLQRDKPLRVWGWAEPGENVAVKLGTESGEATAGKDGRWQVVLKSQPVSKTPLTLTVVGKNTIAVKDVLLGDVWLCSGQSNMHWPLKLSQDGDAAAAAAKLPNLRLMNLVGQPYPSGHEFSGTELATCVPEKYLTGSWTVSSPQTVPDFSAVAFHFGRELLDNLDVPIGLIHNAIGGTPTEAWVSRGTLATIPKLKPLLDEWFENDLVHSFCRKRAAHNLGVGTSGKAAVAPKHRHPYQPGFMYESGIEPLAGYAIRGVIWYQGESNVHNATLHDDLLPALIGEWRRAWGQGDFPFLYVQLPNLEGGSEWPAFRESQRRALRVRNTGMVVSIDIGDPKDVHPKNKADVGDRLARWALANEYGKKIVPSGPLFRGLKIDGNNAVVEFDHVGSGLMVGRKEGRKPVDEMKDGKLARFAIAGKDKKWVWATAVIAGDTVVCTHPDVPNPVAVRYAYTMNPVGANLYNRDGLPASPFHTDDW